MTLPQAFSLLRYWKRHPPACELLEIGIRTYTGWGKEPPRPPTRQELQKSLEQRWNAGALNPKQLYEIFGGKPVAASATRH